MEGMLSFFALIIGTQIWATRRSQLLASSQWQYAPDASECLIPVLVEAKPQNVYLICQSNETFCPSTVVEYFPEAPWRWTLMDDLEPIWHFQDDMRSDDICIFAANQEGSNDTEVYEMFLPNETYAGVFPNVGLCYRARIVLFFPSNASLVLEKYQPFFDESWDSDLIDIVFMLTDQLHCFAYTYVPFQPNGECNDTSPVLLQSWEKGATRALKPTVTFFPHNKILSLYSCKFFLFCDVSIKDQVLKDSIEEFMRFLESALSSKVLHVDREWMDAHASLIGHAYKNLAYIGWYTGTRRLFTRKTDLTFAVPIRRKALLEWFRLSNELSPAVWYSILLSFPVAAGAFYVCVKNEKVNFGLAVLFMVGPLLSGSGPNRPFRWHARMFLGVWIVICFILDSIYLCTFLSQLTVPFVDDEIKSLSDLADSNLTILHPISELGLAEGIFYDTPYERILERFLYIGSDYFDIDNSTDDVAYFISSFEFEKLFFNMSYRTIPSEGMLSKIENVISLLDNSPFERVFETALLRADSAGGWVYNERKIKPLTNRNELPDEKPKPLPLKSFSVLFLILGVGWFAGLLVFVIELCR